MKHFFRNILIILFCLSSIPFWRRVFLQLYSQEPGSRLLRVWCLHEIKDNQVNQFESKLLYLKNKYNIITPKQFINQELSSDKVNILITFDDGFESWNNNALPILKRHGVKAIFFIRKSFEGKAKQIIADGHRLGGHSITHPYLPKISQEQMEKEVHGSVKSDFFAYPFGEKKSYNDKVIEEVKKAGYKYGFTILPGYNTKKTNPYLLHRDSLDPDVSDFIFKIWLIGSYDLYKKIF